MSEFRFKYKDINEKGQPMGLFSSKAVLTRDSLVMARKTIPLVDVVGADGHSHNAVIVWRGPSGYANQEAFRVTSGGLKNVLRHVNSSCSRAKAARRKQQLIAEDKLDAYREWNCPECQSVVDLSGREVSPQIWCPYCDILVTQNGNPPRGEVSFHTCDQCGLYAQPKPMTVLYFWFAVVAFGYQYEIRRMCNVCMRKEAWKMLLVNFLFVVGVIPSVFQLLRAYFGGSKLSSAFRELDSANAAFHKGDHMTASMLYRRILEKHPDQAGVHFNNGLAQLGMGSTEQAMESFGAALNACINYEPAYGMLERLLHEAGNGEKLERLRRRCDGVDYVPAS